MKKIITISILFLSFTVFAQNVDQINYTTELQNKKTTTFEDAVKMFVYHYGETSKGFEKDLEFLNSRGILKKKYMAYKPERTLKRGQIAYMAAKYLKLKDHMFYMITGAERYAFRACISNKIMVADASENDIISGGELCEIFTSIAEFEGDEE